MDKNILPEILPAFISFLSRFVLGAVSSFCRNSDKIFHKLRISERATPLKVNRDIRKNGIYLKSTRKEACHAALFDDYTCLPSKSSKKICHGVGVALFIGVLIITLFSSSISWICTVTQDLFLRQNDRY